MKPEIITLCGSTKFQEEFIAKNAELTGDGKIVLSVGFFGHKQVEPMPRAVKAKLDVLHLRKIDISDAIYVLNKGGYIGESTEREIAYAQSTGKRIYHLESLGKMRHLSDCATQCLPHEDSLLATCSCGAA